MGKPFLIAQIPARFEVFSKEVIDKKAFQRLLRKSYFIPLPKKVVCILDRIGSDEKLNQNQKNSKIGAIAT